MKSILTLLLLLITLICLGQDETVNGTLTVTGKSISGNLNYGSNATTIKNVILNPNPESSFAFSPYLANDLAHVRLRGATVTASGLNTSTQDRLFDQTANFVSIAQGIIDAGYTIEITNLSSANVAISYAGKYGLAFGHPTWRSKYVKLESQKNGVWQTDLELTNNTEDIIVTNVTGANGTPITGIRITLDDAYHTSGVRINSIFAFDYNSELASRYYLSAAGGTVYGGTTFASNTTTTGLVTVNNQIQTNSTHSIGFLMTNETASQGVGTNSNTFRLVADADGDGTGNISHEIGGVGTVLTNLTNNKYTININTEVNGNIESKKVKVTATPGSFPDYVFKKDYRLLTIDQLADFIKTNGHLPNIPTAKEVEANGQDLGLIQQKLLEKIEQLTLYVIQQNEESRKQKELIDQLLKRIEKLEKK